MLFPYDREEYLNRFVSAAVYTCLHRVGDYMKQARNDASGLYLKKAIAEHKHLVKLIGEIRIEARKPQPKESNERKPNVFLGQCKNLRGNICKNPIFA